MTLRLKCAAGSCNPVPPDPGGFLTPSDTAGRGGVSTARLHNYWSFDGTLLGAPGGPMIAAPEGYFIGIKGLALQGGARGGSYPLDTGVWSFSTWMKLTAGGAVYSTGFGLAGSNNILLLDVERLGGPGSIYMDLWLNGARIGFFGPITVYDRSLGWHNFCISYNLIAGWLSVFEDGISIYSAAAPAVTPPAGAVAGLWVGGSPPLGGGCDETMTMTGEFTAAQALALHAGWSPP